VKLSAAPVALQTSSKTTDISTKTASKSIEEKDIPVASPAKLAPPAASTSSECKEAFAERDLANEAKDNSDKLYHLRRSLRLCPNSAPLHLELGKVYASMERKPDAEREFKQALSIDPNLSAAKSAMGDMLKGEVQF
jgi:Flp pilus assembly protein TadD